MPAVSNARQASRKRRGTAQTRLVAIGLAAIALLLFVAWWSTSNSSPATGSTNAIGLQVSKNPSDTDIGGLQSAEKGAAGQPVLVWFHADW